ncbi:hypothetical protein [Actinomadura xylanilytica]|uniref:hypothetical protein n=1 Tax=Actinomadura xylanilytica TaxID=887459 RepID=UPI00255ABA17|nr:hypothetical protein [Actinomadura xylanilytica]MDL4775229.1 hypothetical protein [Actinomadura xylanilytica]
MATKTIRRGSLLAAGAAVAGALALGAAPVASAAPAAPTDGGTTLTATRSGVNAAAAAVITCKVRIHDPHYSHHAHAKDKHRVNVTADTKCTKKVASLRIKMRLYKNGKPYKTTGWKSNTGKNTISHSAARRCVKKQRYQGRAWVRVVFPPGYKPPTGSSTVTSKAVTIYKCAK